MPNIPAVAPDSSLADTAYDAINCAYIYYCAACPQPGKNMPDDWQTAPPEVCWKFALFLAIDANFCLARRNVSSDVVDPGLSRGWSYFVKDCEFKSFLNDAGTLPQEKSTCASHSAVNLADTKNARGLAVTVLNISHDIACQWSKHIRKCMSSYPSAIHFNHTHKNVVFLVPKFHLPAHITACQIRFSYNLVKGVGRTDGKAPERGWANINPVAMSTRKMGPGSRRDTLDDHFGDFNWKKVSNFGISLLCKIKIAIPERDLHVRDFEDFDQMLSHKRLNEVNAWKLLIERWEEDRSQPNPFEIMSKSMSQAAVHLSLSQKEASNLEHGVNDSLHSDISP
ncbi:hypothetical protein BDR03DRAFT_987823, partial [Suillus americanus]